MSRIENIKYLRQIGASLKLQDDVAKKVGGYESPLFVPTVEFILKLQNSFLSQTQQQEQGITAQQMPNTFDPDIFKGVDLDLASEIVQADDMPKAEKKQAVAYINNMAASRDKFIADNPDFDAEKNLIPLRKKDKKLKTEQQKQTKKSGLVSVIVSAVQAINDKLRQNMDAARLQSQQNVQRNTNQQSSQQVQQQASASIKAAQKKNIMSLFRLKKAVVEQNNPAELQGTKGANEKTAVDKKTTRDEFLKKLKSDQRVQAMHQQQERLGHRVTDDDLLEAAKQAKQQMGDVSKDLIISKMIDNIIKATAEKKDPAKNNANIDEAVAKLQGTGVTNISSNDQQINNKKALEDQVAKQNADQQRQRG